MPKRIQMTRQRPWRKDHPDAVIVARPSSWGNPFKIDPGRSDGRAWAVLQFGFWIDGLENFPDVAPPPDQIDDLRGKDLACWCPLDQPCHADVLLEIANRPK